MLRWPLLRPPLCLLVVLLMSSGALGCRSSETTSPATRAAPVAPAEQRTPGEWKALSEEEQRVIVDKGTERAFTGEFHDHKAAGTYLCKRCGNPLFASDHKFDSRSGWPSFDTALPGAVREVSDADGQRVEIVCAQCGGHLGHVFRGEGFTSEDTRHCVNSVSLDFQSAGAGPARAWFAGGCFWGVESLLEDQPGVLSAVSGYMGGPGENPTYKQVSSGTSGHIETVEVVYDPSKTDYETLARRFFEIHDPTQTDRQGPDVGPQYASVVFYGSDAERAAAERLVGLLQKKGFDVVTRLQPAGPFWPAEDYHQDYYARTGKAPYCHEHVDRFGD